MSPCTKRATSNHSTFRAAAKISMLTIMGIKDTARTGPVLRAACEVSIPAVDLPHSMAAIYNGFVLDCGRPDGGFNGRTWQMPISESAKSAAAIHRKLRRLAAMFADPAATEHEKANAKALKERLEKQLAQETKPDEAWTGIMFRLGQGFKEMTSPPSPKSDWTNRAFQLGRMFRRCFKR